MKKLALVLVFLLPLVSFGAPLSPAKRASILNEIAILEAQLQQLESQMIVAIPVEATTTPVFGSIIATTTPIKSINQQICDGRIMPVGAPMCKWSIDHALGSN